MTMFNASFVDAQGVSQTDAVVQVRFAYLNARQHISMTATGDTYNTSTNDGVDVNFGARYWVSEAAKSAGFAPYILTDQDGNEQFSFSPATAIADDVALIAAVEAHIQTVVLPSLAGGAA